MLEAESVIKVTEPEGKGGDRPSPEPSPESGGSHLVSRVLSPAVMLWLRSQAESLEELEVKIEGRDRQLLSGYIPRVMLAAQHVVYQGLHLGQLRVTAENIRINLGQVLRGKPFRLLEVVPVTLQVALQEEDLNRSLQSDLLRVGVADLLYQLLIAQQSLSLPSLPKDARSVQLQHSCLRLTPGRVTLQANVSIADSAPVNLVLQAGITLVQGRKLQLTQPIVLQNFQDTDGQAIPDLDGFCIDLGPEVNLQTLVIEQANVQCYGQINVIP